MLVNATPHAVMVCDAAGEVLLVIPASGQVARCAEHVERAAAVDGVPTSVTDYGGVCGLPDPTEGVFYIVSPMVRDALPERDDLLAPAELVRDDEGRIVGCRSLGRRHLGAAADLDASTP